jgi:hypothetical protein
MICRPRTLSLTASSKKRSSLHLVEDEAALADFDHKALHADLKTWLASLR